MKNYVPSNLHLIFGKTERRKITLLDLFFSTATNQAKTEFSELNFSIYIFFFVLPDRYKTLPMFADVTEMLC